MNAKENESPKKESSNSEDLDLEHIGIELSEKTIDLDPRSLPVIVGAIVLLGVVVGILSEITQTITAFVVALLFSLAIDPLIVKIQYLSFKRLPINQKLDENGEPVERIGRYSAVCIVLVTFAIFVSSISYIMGPRVVEEVANFSNQIPKTVEGLASLPIVGDRLGTESVQESIREALESVPARLSSQDSPLGDILRTFVDGAYLGLLFFLMLIALLLDGPRIVRNTRRMINPDRRPAADRLASAFHRVIGKYMAGSIFIAVLAGFTIGTYGLILGVPLAPLLGLWVVFTNLIPQFGGALGMIPFTVFGFTESPLIGILAFAGFWVYQTIENNVLQPIIIGKTVSLSPPVTMVAALVGVSIGGVLGALLAVPLVGATKALAAEFDFPKGARERAMELDRIDEELLKNAHVKKNKKV